MESVPDAPWIRDAELNGWGTADTVECPICGAECEILYEDKDGDIFGCDRCVRERDAYDWLEERREAEMDDT